MFFIKRIESLKFKKFSRNNITNMESMFYGCSSLKELNLSNFNTDNVIDMAGMFDGCSDQLQNKIRAQYQNIKEEAFKKLNFD